ncbi:BZ3500_MvSof-1268-A1-R1_Chr6-1g08400 [Microbotryum saponariae]|uniref:BZ3500_MvSof-1268-A1-R1_Chr6-1g08400 protein n=1 Tax=Microbotryum saponariae TaxID=289078 RepID=A0A2X0KKJ3_9BASI|nr:BZ3500_MvSof-1268-A1-R1_Chr6-1g08400 [Microbotryum saponariae]SDA07684.1 BZ3501_MvSof-1269-A2-R1_Chr6-1g08121 [Microbotryum saponariae]
MKPAIRPILLLALGSFVTYSWATSIPQQQHPFVPPTAGDSHSQGPAMTIPKTNPFLSSSTNAVSSTTMALADLLTQSRRTSIFYDYCRDVPSVSALLNAPPSPSKETLPTLLVPLNSAIIAMAHKPHQTQPKTDSRSPQLRTERQLEDESNAYLSRWVRAHVIQAEVQIGPEGWQDKTYETLDHSSVQFALRKDETTNEERVVIIPGQIEVVGMSQASNGMIYYIDGTLNVGSV